MHPSTNFTSQTYIVAHYEHKKNHLLVITLISLPYNNQSNNSIDQIQKMIVITFT
jgi:hypothetical protein